MLSLGGTMLTRNPHYWISNLPPPLKGRQQRNNKNKVASGSLRLTSGASECGERERAMLIFF